MRKNGRTFFLILLAVLTGTFSSCVQQLPGGTETFTTTITVEKSRDDTPEQANPLPAELNSVKEDSATKNSLYQTKIAELEETVRSLQAEIKILNETLESRQKNEEMKLHDPSWVELKRFLQNDDTDRAHYDKVIFDCSGYALVLRDRARARGIRTAYVEIEIEDSSGHALNAFETAENLLVYVDVTEADKIAYVQKGSPYGTIPLEAVREKYIACNITPDKFWMPLSYTSVSNPFNYNYYLDYVRRWEFYHATVEAFNHEVTKFNNQCSELTLSQMETWKSNIQSLEEELGNIYYEPMEIVLNIELYWGDNP